MGVTDRSARHTNFVGSIQPSSGIASVQLRIGQGRTSEANRAVAGQGQRREERRGGQAGGLPDSRPGDQPSVSAQLVFVRQRIYQDQVVAPRCQSVSAFHSLFSSIRLLLIEQLYAIVCLPQSLLIFLTAGVLAKLCAETQPQVFLYFALGTSKGEIHNAVFSYKFETLRKRPETSSTKC